MSRTKEELLAASVQVKTETVKGANSADRIGGILYDISEHIGEGSGNPFPTPTGAGYLHFNGANYLWDTPSGGGGATTLGGLNDVTISNPSEGQVLKYSGGQWINGSGGGSGSGIDWSDLVSHGKWWNQSLTKSGDNYLVKGPLAGEISYIEFSNGVRLGVDNENASTLKVYNNGTAQANFYATGGVSALGYNASGSGGGGSSFEPNDLVGSLNTKSGMPDSGQILVYRGAGWAYEDKPTGGGSGGGEMNVIDAITFNGNPVPVSNKVAAITANIPSKVSDLTNDAGYINDVSSKLDVTAFTNAKWWGQEVKTIDGKYVVQGDMEAGAAGGAIKGFHSLELNTHNTGSDHGGFIDFHYKGSLSQDEITPDYTARIIEDSLGILHIESMERATTEKLQRAGLHVGQSFDGSFIQIGDIRLIYESNSGALRVAKWNGSSEVAAHLYATGGISALGIQPEVTGLESFTISHLKSTDIEIAENTSIQDNDTDILNVITKNSEIKFTVNVNNYSDDIQPSLIVREEGIMAKNTLNGVNEPGIFYFDSNHWLYIDSSGNLKYHKGLEGDKTVVLQ